MSSAEVSKVGELAQLTKAGSLSSDLSSQHSPRTAPCPRSMHSLMLGADWADLEARDTGLAGVTPRELPSLCIARPGVDTCSQNLAPCKPWN